MIRMLDTIFLFIFLALFAQRAGADDTNNIPSAEQQLLKAIAQGDLAGVKRVAAVVDLNRVANLPGYALASPNAEVVEFLRAACDFNISDLQIAAIRGEAMKVRRILAPLDKKSKVEALAVWYAPPLYSSSPLALAIRRGRTNAVRELISLGANVNEATHYSLTPLANAAEFGHVEIVKLLLRAGAQVDAAPDGYTALMRACCGGRPETARLLLDARADPNRKRHDGQRALHFAAKSGNAECVKLLLKHGADIDAVAYGKDTALTYAELYKFPAVVKLLRETKPD